MNNYQLIFSSYRWGFSYSRVRSPVKSITCFYQVISYLLDWQRDLTGKERRNLEGRGHNLIIKIGKVPLENSSTISIQVHSLGLSTKLSHTRDDPNFQHWLMNVRTRALMFLNRISSQEGPCVRTLRYCFATIGFRFQPESGRVEMERRKKECIKQTHWSFCVKVFMRFSM